MSIGLHGTGIEVKNFGGRAGRLTGAGNFLITNVIRKANEGRDRESEALVEKALPVAHSNTPDITQVGENDDDAVKTGAGILA